MKKSYDKWKLELIDLIANDKRLHVGTRIEEIKCALKDDGGYPESFKDGDSPEDAWDGEIEAIKDSM